MACVMSGELSLQPFLTPTSHPFRPSSRKSAPGLRRSPSIRTTAAGPSAPDITYIILTRPALLCVYPTPHQRPCYYVYLPAHALPASILSSVEVYATPCSIVSTALIVPFHDESVVDGQATTAASYITQEDSRIVEYEG